MTTGTIFVTVFLGMFIGLIICLLMITIVENVIFEEGQATSKAGRIVMLMISLLLGFATAFNLIN